MENRVNALERWASDQEKAMVEVKMDIAITKDSLKISEDCCSIQRKMEKF